MGTGHLESIFQTLDEDMLEARGRQATLLELCPELDELEVGRHQKGPFWRRHATAVDALLLALFVISGPEGPALVLIQRGVVSAGSV